MADLNDPLNDSYISKVADALVPYADELKRKGSIRPAGSSNSKARAR